MHKRTETAAAPAETDEQAARLWRMCNEDNPAVDAAMVASIQRRMQEIFQKIFPNYSPDYRGRWLTHAARLAATVWFLRQAGLAQESALEIGEVSVASHIMADYFPKVRWQRSDWDIRRGWPTADNPFDCIICTEVIEHLCDVENDVYAVWRSSGLRAFLVESLRSLRPGGYVFASTPNAHSALCLHHALLGYAPMFYQPHLREYGRDELTRIAQSCGFIVERMISVQCLTMDAGIDLTKAFRSLLVAGASTEDRGDDWFMLLRKPAG
jgi:SAM-dependent methyltransferase